MHKLLPTQVQALQSPPITSQKVNNETAPSFPKHGNHLRLQEPDLPFPWLLEGVQPLIHILCTRITSEVSSPKFGLHVSSHLSAMGHHGN